jgi:hypothetical protein
MGWFLLTLYKWYIEYLYALIYNIYNLKIALLQIKSNNPLLENKYETTTSSMIASVIFGRDQ